jgi:hypothetical protein
MTGLRFPKHDTLFYGGDWHRPAKDAVQDVCSLATGERIGRVSVSCASLHRGSQFIAAGCNGFDPDSGKWARRESQ